jgi:hypothetical protein
MPIDASASFSWKWHFQVTRCCRPTDLAWMQITTACADTEHAAAPFRQNSNLVIHQSSPPAPPKSRSRPRADSGTVPEVRAEVYMR